MKKRILLVSPSELCVGGVSKVILTLVEELHREYTFDLAALNDKSGYFDDAFSAYGGMIYRIPSVQYLDHKILHPVSFLQIRKGIGKILKSTHYDAIHCHAGYLSGACQLAAAQAGVPVRISHAHGTYIWHGRNLMMRFYFWLGKKCIRKHANVRLACSSISGDSLFLGESYNNVLNPVDILPYADMAKMQHNGIHLLQIGYYCALKNQMFTIRLVEHLRQRGVDVRLSLIGYPKEPAYFEQLKSLVEEKNLSEYVSFLPRDFDKCTAFANADYCLLPSETEGLPLVALESQAAGVPCIMSDNISRESDIGAGVFLPHNDLTKWSETVLCGVSVDSQRLAESLQEISVQAYVNKIKEIYEQKA